VRRSPLRATQLPIISRSICRGIWFQASPHYRPVEHVESEPRLRFRIYAQRTAKQAVNGPSLTAHKLLVLLGAEGGSRTRTSFRTTDFKSRDGGATYSYQTIQASIYAPSGRQGIASAGLVSTRPATILAPSSLIASRNQSRSQGPHSGQSSQLPLDANDGNAQFLPNLAGAVVWHTSHKSFKKVLRQHSGHSSQLVSDANDRNAQFLPTVTRSALARQVDRSWDHEIGNLTVRLLRVTTFTNIYRGAQPVLSP
jgi:hypothetical protein